MVVVQICNIVTNLDWTKNFLSHSLNLVFYLGPWRSGSLGQLLTLLSWKSSFGVTSCKFLPKGSNPRGQRVFSPPKKILEKCKVINGPSRYHFNDNKTLIHSVWERTLQAPEIQKIIQCFNVSLYLIILHRSFYVDGLKFYYFVTQTIYKARVDGLSDQIMTHDGCFFMCYPALTGWLIPSVHWAC